MATWMRRITLTGCLLAVAAWSGVAGAGAPRLLALGDNRIGRKGVLVIKAREFRSQEQNREQALARLQALVRQIAVTRKPRIATKPSRSSQRKRMDSKTRRGRTKALRRRVDD